MTPDDIKAIAKQILDGETVPLRHKDGTTDEVSIRKAIQRILNPDAS